MLLILIRFLIHWFLSGFVDFYQVIVQGLRESGIFTAIIESASTSSSKDKFLSSIESSNSTRHESVVSSRNVNRNTESRATARRVLQFIDVIPEAAVPPLPAPNVDQNKMVESR